MSNKKSKSKKNIYYNKSRVTNNYNNVKFVINVGQPKKSKIDKNDIVTQLLVLFVFVVLWKFGILVIVKTNWEDIEPMIDVLEGLFFLVKRFVVERNESQSTF